MAGPQQLPLFDDGDGHMPVSVPCSVLDDLADAIGLMADDDGNLMAGTRSARSTEYRTIARPATECSTFVCLDCIRFPNPAAMTTAATPGTGRAALSRAACFISVSFTGDRLIRSALLLPAA